MADFRKWFLAFAVVALLSSFATPVFAQAAVTCNATAGVPPVIRSEGVAEQVGDVVLNCTGGVPSPGNINVQIFLNAFVTSKLTSNGLSDALLLLGEPSGTGLNLCPANTDCSTGSYNAFQGQLQNLQTSSNGTTGYTSIVWTGIPFTPPGSGTAVIRITNIRADALSAPPSGGQFIPQTIQEFIAINGVHGVAINPSQLTVAYLQPGILFGTGGTGNFLQCQGRNTDLLTGGSATITDFAATITEGFASSFKPIGGPEQSVPGTNYFTENGFTSASFPVAGIGTATNATRFFVNIAGVQSGVSIFLPTSIPLFRASDGAQTGLARLVTCDTSGTTCAFASSSGAAPTSVLVGPFSGSAGGALTTFFGAGASVPLATATLTGNNYYEVVSSDPFTVESVAIPVTFAYNSGLAITTNTPAPTVTVGLAPQNTDTMNLATDPIPRFGPSAAPATSLPFQVGNCQCNILFPYVTSRANYDTGIAISNTSMDPWNATATTSGGTVMQHGTITFHFYGDIMGAGGGTPTPLPSAQQTGTSPDIPAGTTYAFSLYSGDSANGATVQGIVGFSGYVIATANFQFCHGYAFISGFGRGAFDQGASEGYLGLILDTPGLYRATGVTASEALNN